MIENIQNTLNIQCADVDLQTVSQIEFYIRQGRILKLYAPRVVDANNMIVTIPVADAHELTCGAVRLQFAFVDADGNPRASEIVQLPVGAFLKEAGYDPF